LAVICTVPMPTPVTCGFEVGTRRPFGITMLGVTVAIDGSELVNVIVVSPVALFARLTGKLSDCVGATVGIVPRLMRFEGTPTFVLTVAKPEELALIDVLPTTMPFTVNDAIAVLAGMVNVAGVTVAIDGSALVRFTMRPPAGAAWESVIVPLMERPMPTS